ncbi:nudix hydrolase 18, mitochondrial-like [Camellia sinensis]|uniref:nudix hydrolase 18, mitochondrial-like n=1 Tax=Camellia sinensis TaxID=4442 RepID=UPI0010368182|nr:nudix hydrolase 18, mitochondrial-like [Camellia sinensis]
MMYLASSRTGRQFQRYNNSGCRLVVGCIPYRFRKTNQSHGPGHREELEVLLISSQKGQTLLFPKGGWESDESVEEAALRESLEEAGVVGIVERELGKWRFKSKSQGKFHEGYMFPLFVEEELDVWPEKNARQRIWMRVDEAREACAHWWMKEALDILVGRLILAQQKEGENRTPCALEFLMTEEQRIGMMMVAQNGEEEVDCCLY